MSKHASVQCLSTFGRALLALKVTGLRPLVLLVRAVLRWRWVRAVLQWYGKP